MTDAVWDMNVCAAEVGRLIGNIQSLEMSIRLVVFQYESGRPSLFPLEILKQGARVPSNAMTNYDTLNQMLGKYNSRVQAKHRIDAEPIIALRDALAHGRAFLMKDGLPLELRLVKFGREENGLIPVELVIDITQEWCVNQRSLLLAAMEQAANAYEDVSGYKVSRPTSTN